MAKAGERLNYDELRRHWAVLPPCLAGIMLASTHGYSLGVMIPSLESEFGWARAEISSGMMIIAIVALFGAPLVGFVIDRAGPRRIGLFGIAFFCATLALLSTATGSILNWWLLWAVLGIANMFVLPTVWMTAINSYFDRNRGIALALALCGTGVAAAILPSLTQALVAAFGWRNAYLWLALLGLVITLPLTWRNFHMRRSAPGAMAATAGAPAAAPAAAPAVLRGVTARQGYAMPSFIKLASAIALFSVAICALTTNAYPVLLAQGLGPATAAATAGLMGVGSILGRLLGGLLLDRFHAGRVAAMSVSLPIVTVLLLLSFPGSASAAGIACLVLGLAIGTEVDCCAYLAARHFGIRAFGALFGTMNGLMLFGNGIAPVLANHVYDVTKSYDLVLWSLIPALQHP
jgi:MFS family permease